MVVAVVVIIIVVVATVVVLRGFAGKSSNGTDVLIPAGSVSSISGGQYFGINFILSGNGTVNATYSTEFSVDFYVMTPAEYQFLVTKNNVSGYIWDLVTPGLVEIGYIDIPLHAGQWVFAMANPNATVATAIGWITPLTLST
jgi:hypothetical protein